MIWMKSQNRTWNEIRTTLWKNMDEWLIIRGEVPRPYNDTQGEYKMKRDFLGVATGSTKELMQILTFQKKWSKPKKVCPNL